MKSSCFSLFFLCMHAMFLVACSPGGSVTSLEKHVSSAKIVCTTGMIADVVRAVVGDMAVVEGLLGTGVDPHLYKPTRADVVKLSSADVVFYNGLHLEGKMSVVLDGLMSGERTVVAVADAALQRRPDLELKESAGAAGQVDPHLWMNVEGWIVVLDVIADALCEYSPVNASEFRANASVYRARLERLNAYVAASLSTIPERQRILVTAHDAFGDRGEAYGIEVRGIQGLSTESEAGLRDLEDLVDSIVESNLPAVFAETSVADKYVRALVEGAASRGCLVAIGGNLFSDAMGVPGSYEGTYIGMMDHNATTIANALGGYAQGFSNQ